MPMQSQVKFSSSTNISGAKQCWSIILNDLFKQKQPNNKTQIKNGSMQLV